MPAGLFARYTLPGISFWVRLFVRKRCLHPCRGALRGKQNRWYRSRSTTGYRLGCLRHPIRIRLFCFSFSQNAFVLMDTLCVPRRFDLLDPQPHDSTFSIKCALSRLPVQARAQPLRKQPFRGDAPSLLTRPIENSEEPPAGWCRWASCVPSGGCFGTRGSKASDVGVFSKARGKLKGAT
jgi:hypothetical protein